MIIIGVLSVVVQLMCAIHVIRSGRNSLWLMAIVFFSLLGCFAYFCFEIMPNLGMNRTMRMARARAAHRIDPERELRNARDLLATADTADAHRRMGEALGGLGRHGEAVAAYREALGRTRGTDRGLLTRLALAQLEAGDAAAALATVDAIPAGTTVGDYDRIAFVRARTLEALGRNADALAIYADIITRLPGDEARCRYAALLLAMGDRSGATAVLAEVEQRARRLSLDQRVADAEMYNWARDKLAELRG